MSSGDGERLAQMPASELVVSHLRKAIHLGTIRPGEKFPPERVHAAQLGVSRVTLREAIRVLEREGLIRITRGATGGAAVVDRNLPRELTRQQLARDIESLRGIADFRLANERCAAERAATRTTQADIDALEMSLDALKNSESIGEFRQADTFFHLRIADMADCALLRDAVERGRAAMFIPLDLLDSDLMQAECLRAHRRILNALKEGSARKAGRAMADHLAKTRADLEIELGQD